MSPRIRSLLGRPSFAAAKRSTSTEASKVFREFVETLQRLDTPRGERMPPRKRGHANGRRLGNGHARPHSRARRGQ